MVRKAQVTRETRETRIQLELTLGVGAIEISTGLPFVDHMLEAFARHGRLGLVIQAQGDLEVDAHHTLEDLGLTLGRALKEALGDKASIRRFGSAYVPMDEALARVVVDLSGRPHLAYRVTPPSPVCGGFDSRLFHEFFQALANAGALTLHLDLIAGAEVHHAFEALFKAFGRALAEAVALDAGVKGVPSTKGVLE
ncbi:MAG: imidazoleglycerol-phosphate dehydratase HisB [Lentisphaerae bacterium]|nr:imidazoleglycerol-phosphate dehydratase HisB [Lentisphaerota bacterium]